MLSTTPNNGPQTVELAGQVVHVGNYNAVNQQNNLKPQIKLKYKTDLDKNTLIQNFEKRGWQKAQGDEDWNIFWALPWTVK